MSTPTPLRFSKTLPIALAGVLFATTGCECLIRFLGLGHPDPTVLTPKILAACADMRSRLNAGQTIVETDYVAFDQHSNLGAGEHAALILHFGLGQQRKIFVIDIGRRPADSKSQSLSVLRVFDTATFIKYVDKGRTSQQSISFLCPDLPSRTIASNVLHDLEPFLKAPYLDPVEWKFNLLFHNCARYVQERLAQVVTPPALQELVASYQQDKLITPTQFGEHLQVCELVAQMIVAGEGMTVTPAMVATIRHYLQTVSAADRHKWLEFIQSHNDKLQLAHQLQ